MFTADYKEHPYWWDQTAPAKLDESPLPQLVDVLIVGAGFTGLHAAIETARAGLDTLVIDAEHAGFGASTRNGGQISTSIKPSVAELSRKHGVEAAHAVHREGKNSMDFTAAFIASENIACHYENTGRFHAAHNPAQYESLAKSVQNQIPGLEDDAFMVSKAEQRSELGSDIYHGGAVYPHHSSVDPAAYHKGLLDVALKSGAKIIPFCKALSLNRDKDGFQVQTAKGIVRAKKVAIATNGYTGALTPNLQRRVIPIGSYIIATEPLDKALMDQLMPTNRVVSDTRKVVYYYRPSPDRSRILFGGRVSLNESDPRLTGPKLHKSLSEIFPELASRKISHSWTGLVAFSFDNLMHIGNDDDLYFAMGYCGSGVAMSGYFGMKMGKKILAHNDGQTAFDQLKFQTRPFYTGKPWFLAPSILYYKFMDRLNV